MNWQFDGLPLHPLIVHFAVVLIPTAALSTLLAAVWPAFRRRVGIIIPLAALAALLSVPLATQSGGALEEQVGESDLVEAHTSLGETMLPWAVAIFVLAIAQWASNRYFTRPNQSAPHDRSRIAPRLLNLTLIPVIAIAAVGSVVTVIRIGESGARAVWTDTSNQNVEEDDD